MAEGVAVNDVTFAGPFDSHPSLTRLCAIVVAGIWIAVLSSCTPETEPDASVPSSTVVPVVVPAGVTGTWVLAEGYHEQLGLASSQQVVVSVRYLGLEAAPYDIDVTLGCGYIGGGTDTLDPLRVTEVTVEGLGCDPGLEDDQLRVSSTVLGAMPTASVDNTGLRIQTSQGETIILFLPSSQSQRVLLAGHAVFLL